MIIQYFSQSLWITFLLCGGKVLRVSPRYMCYFPIKFPLQRKWKMEIPILFQYSWRHFSKNRKYYTFSRISWTRFVWIQVVCEMRNGKFHTLQTTLKIISHWFHNVREIRENWKFKPNIFWKFFSSEKYFFLRNHRIENSPYFSMIFLYYSTLPTGFPLYRKWNIWNETKRRWIKRKRLIQICIWCT